MNYDRDYFENGVDSKKSLYVDYKWLPELTIPLAFKIAKALDFPKGKILDFGCAKGYLVKALRLLGFDAYGVDISEYAIDNSDRDVRNYISHVSMLNALGSFEAVIAKDVLEHIPYDQIDEVIDQIMSRCEKFFVIVPLGDGKKYVIDDYELDSTHIIREDISWWSNKLYRSGSVIDVRYVWGDIKKRWVEKNHLGNGFLLARRN